MKCKTFLLLNAFLFSSTMGKAQPGAALKYHPDLIGINFQFPNLINQYSLLEKYGSGNILKIEQTEYSRKKWDDLSVDVNSWPVFCRIEIQMEKAVNIPIKFRLGEVQYVERMEGKY